MKRLLKITVSLLMLLLLASCSLLPGIGTPTEEDEGVTREKNRVSLVYSEGIGYYGENPVSVTYGASVSFEIVLAPTYKITSVDGGSYDPLTRVITVDEVTSDMRIRATAENVGYDTISKYDYHFGGGELDKTSIGSMSGIFAGTEITVEAGDSNLIFRGWSLGDYCENGAEIISEERVYSFILNEETVKGGLCSIYPNYSGRETNVLYYDLNGGSVNTESRNMKNTASYTAELDGDYVKVTLGKKYYENVGACACIFWDDGTFYRDGYVLAEFNTKPDGSGEGYGSGYKFSLKDGASVLYCIWKENTDPSLFTYEDCSIPLPSGIKRANAPDWQENGVRITKYLGDESEVVVPETIDGKPVISIGTGAFSSPSINTIVLSRFILEIKDRAFERLFYLDTIYYPDSVYYVSDNILDEYSKETLNHLYVNATMAPRYTCGSEIYAHKFARFLANADKNRVVLMAGSSGLYGFSGGYLEALLEGEYCVVNFGMVMSVNTQFALALTSYYGHEGDVLLYCPETSIRNCGTPHIYWKGIAYIESMYNVFRVIDMSTYTNIFNSFAEVNQGSSNVTSRYKRSPNTYESRMETQNTYCEADAANRYYLNDGTKYNFNPKVGSGEKFTLKWENPDVGGSAYVTDEPYTTNINALLRIAHANGVKTYFGFPPITDRYVDASIRANLDEVIAAYESGILEAFEFDGLLGTAKNYIFNVLYFYDSSYHPNNYGKTYRTYQVYLDLCEKLGITDVNGYYDVGTKDDFFATLFEEGVVDGKPLVDPDIDP